MLEIAGRYVDKFSFRGSGIYEWKSSQEWMDDGRRETCLVTPLSAPQEITCDGWKHSKESKVDLGL